MNHLSKLVTELSNLTVVEMIELKKALESEWGVTAAVATAAAAPAAAAAAVEEKTAFDVVLKTPGDKKIDVIKIVREKTGLGLKEAKDLVEAADSKIKSGISKADAETLKKELEAVGAKVEIK